MDKIIFELTNEQRKYLGLTLVEKKWELVKLFGNYIYFDGDIIRKEITVKDNTYYERDLNEKTTENRTILLPKTSKGKPKKLNFTGTQSFSPFGVYFKFSSDYVIIASFTTQTTYHREDLPENSNLENLKRWLEKWISETTETDLKEIEDFKLAKRKNHKFKEGDFFAFKIDRKNWGFGRILIDVAKRKKTDKLKEQKNYGLTNIPTKPLIVKVYHKISSSINVSLDELAKTLALPSQAIMDNNFFYGEYKIIGSKDLTLADFDDAMISYGRSINGQDRDTVYLQYGLIFKETTISEYSKYLKETNGLINPYRNEGIGFGLYTEQLEDCIKDKSNKPFWKSASELDLRNPKSINTKKEIFQVFGLNADKNYEQNLMMIE